MNKFLLQFAGRFTFTQLDGVGGLDGFESLERGLGVAPRGPFFPKETHMFKRNEDD